VIVIRVLQGYLFVFLFLIGTGSAVFAQSEEENGAFLVGAFNAADAGDWPKAAKLAARVSDKVASDLIEWMRLREGGADWADYQKFMKTHADWPGMARVRQRSEAAIPEGYPATQVIAYFKGRFPQTGVGILRLTQALTSSGQTDEAKKIAIRAWRLFGMTRDERVTLLSRFKKTLAPYHKERLDMLLWRNLKKHSEGLYSLVPKGYVKLAKARLGLRNRAHGVDALISAVPADLKGDAGLAYERFNWRARKGLYESARDLMIERSTSAKALGRPDKWAGRRRTIARQEMRDGNNKRAYLIASKNFLTSGSDYADLEWLSGYIALRKLGDPARALAHFKRFRAAIGTPISFGRAGYWIGRAYEALGDSAPAKEAYKFAAGYQTSFYGQLAAEKIGAPPDKTLAGRETSPDWRLAPFLNDTVIRAALLLHYADAPRLSERFFRQKAESLDRTGLQQLADLVMELGRPNFSVRVSKQAARQGHVLAKTYFPLTEIVKKKLKVAPEVAMSIARRESELDQYIISPAGARGLMQIMPSTARKIARKIGVAYSRKKLTSDWEYNVLLGSSYLAEQLKAFNGSYILAFAAYNAGPHRAKRWVARYGDPRKNGVDPVDWIEHIPFRETRNYVMRVIESLYVYRARIKGHTPAIRITKDLKRG